MLLRTRIKRRFNVIIVILTILLILFCLWSWNIIKIRNVYDGVAASSSRIKNKQRTVLYRTDTNLQIDKHASQFDDFSSIEYQYTEEELAEQKTEYFSNCVGLQNCFNFDRCSNGFYIYVYPIDNRELISPMYIKILEAIKSSIYYTSDPQKACVFILSLDTLDRDILSKLYIKNLQSKVNELEYWNDGENHVIINFFSGTWPYYYENLALNFGKAIIAKASFSMSYIRSGYDISIPLLPKAFFSESLPIPEEEKSLLFPIQRKYLISFKGKRYLYGIGSETRNSLHLLNNDKDIVLLTTCRHGKGWEKVQDERCPVDNQKYDRYDYQDLLANATFCLVPRGRRLGSFRFLEVIERGCIPILLSNGWELPYKEVLDWSKFSLSIDERLLLQLPSIVRSIPDNVILSMKQQVLFVWKTYFSSVRVTIGTMLEVLRERIMPNLRRPYVIWNKPPGALNIDARFSSSVSRLPFYGTAINSLPYNRFTAVILAVNPILHSTAPLFSLIHSINLSKFVDQILVVWLSPSAIPKPHKWPKTTISLRVVNNPEKSLNSRYVNMDIIKTDAIFSFDEDVQINAGEIDFAFSVWLSNPGRLIGYQTSTHYLDTDKEQFKNGTWKLTSKLANQFSVVHTSSALYHRYYNHHYSLHTPKAVRAMVEREKACESLAMNFVISHLNGKSPIKVARSAYFKPASLNKERLGVSFTQMQHFEIEQKCFDELKQIFDGIPLVHSKVAMNPLLFRDPVSIARKKFRKLG